MHKHFFIYLFDRLYYFLFYFPPFPTFGFVKIPNSSPYHSSNQKNVRSGVSALSSTSSSFGTVVANGRLDSQNGIDESLKLKVLAEEEAAINQFNKVFSMLN